MATSDKRIQDAMESGFERIASGFKHLARSLSDASFAIDGLRLSVPTEDIRAIRQEATDAIDRVMR